MGKTLIILLQPGSWQIFKCVKRVNEVNATSDSFSIVVRLWCCCEGIPAVNNLRGKIITVQDFRGS